MLLHAVVELPLDPAAVGIGGQDEPLPRRAQLLDLEAQPVERLLQRLDVPEPPERSTSSAVAEVVRHRAGGVKWPSIPMRREASLPRTRLPPP